MSIVSDDQPSVHRRAPADARTARSWYVAAMRDGRRAIAIDTDTASDDAVALLMALRHPGVEVVAITVVAGNVPLQQAVQNAREASRAAFQRVLHDALRDQGPN